MSTRKSVSLFLAAMFALGVMAAAAPFAVAEPGDPNPAKFEVSCELVLPPGSKVMIPVPQITDVVAIVTVAGVNYQFVVGDGSFWLNPAKGKLFMVQKKGAPELDSCQFGIDKAGLLLNGAPKTAYHFQYDPKMIDRIDVAPAGGDK
jgi:hypothetical protein